MDFRHPDTYRIPTGNLPTGVEYLIALAKTDRGAFICATTGREAGWIRYKPFSSDESKIQKLIPFSRHLITIDEQSLAGVGVQDKTLIVEANNEVSVSGCYRYAAFAPLPVSALGTKYIIPFCGVAGRESVLVIAAYDREIDVSITLNLKSEAIEYDGKEYRDGDTIAQTLGSYQTFSFTFEHDVTGTVIETSSAAGVFLGSIYSKQIDTYDQLLPVSMYGDDYVVALEDDRENHELQIMSEHSDTQIRFNDGTVLKGAIHSKAFKNNETFQFKSTRPVMASICRRSRSVYYSSFVVVPPVKSYLRKKVAFYIPYSKVVTSVKMITRRSADVKIDRYTEETSPSVWSEVPGTDYKVGTCKISNKFATSFSANDSFTVLAFSYYFVQNGGYGYEGQEIAMASAERMSQSDSVSSPLLLVSIICGLVIIALLVVIAIVATHLRRSRAREAESRPRETDQPSGSTTTHGGAGT